MKSGRFLLSIVAVTGAATVAPLALSQTWSYQTYDATGKMMAPGNITLTDKGGGEYSFKMVAANLDQCWNANLKVTVEKTDAITTIETVPPYQGCAAVRFVIKNDGSGGERQNKTKSGDWRGDGRDRGLTLKQ